MYVYKKQCNKLSKDRELSGSFQITSVAEEKAEMVLVSLITPKQPMWTAPISPYTNEVLTNFWKGRLLNLEYNHSKPYIGGFISKLKATDSK